MIYYAEPAFIWHIHWSSWSKWFARCFRHFLRFNFSMIAAFSITSAFLFAFLFAFFFAFFFALLMVLATASFCDEFLVLQFFHQVVQEVAHLKGWGESWLVRRLVRHKVCQPLTSVVLLPIQVQDNKNQLLLLWCQNKVNKTVFTSYWQTLYRAKECLGQAACRNILKKLRCNKCLNHFILGRIGSAKRKYSFLPRLFPHRGRPGSAWACKCRRTGGNLSVCCCQQCAGRRRTPRHPATRYVQDVVVQYYTICILARLQTSAEFQFPDLRRVTKWISRTVFECQESFITSALSILMDQLLLVSHFCKHLLWPPSRMAAAPSDPHDPLDVRAHCLHATQWWLPRGKCCCLCNRHPVQLNGIGRPWLTHECL